MKNVMGLINLHEDESGVRELTRHRPLAAIPFAGRFRLIDFALSNLVNAGIHTVGVLVYDKYRSLMDHLRSGKEWDLARKRDGLYILPPAPASVCLEDDVCRGDLENFYAHLDYIHSGSEDHVLVCGSRTVCNLSLAQVVQYHKAVGADVTVVGRDWSQSGSGICLHISPEGRILSAGDSEDDDVPPELESMDFCVMSKSLFYDLVKSSVTRPECTFLHELIFGNLQILKVFAFRHSGYTARIDSVPGYFRQQMELLTPAVWQELFFRYGNIYTKVKDEAPAKYRKNAIVRNSLVANGSVISGKVENSILFRSVIVEPGAEIRNCVLMQNTLVGQGARLENVLCDKDVRITRGKKYSGKESQPFFIQKGAVM